MKKHKTLKTFKTLERLQQFHINRIVPVLQKLMKTYQETQDEIANLQKDAAKEEENLTPLTTLDYGSYYYGICEKIKTLETQLRIQETELARIREDLHKHFAEVKRYETSINRVKKSIQSEEDKKVMDILDDIAQRQKN